MHTDGGVIQEVRFYRIETTTDSMNIRQIPNISFQNFRTFNSCMS
jgi:hypothetical protein